VLNYIAVIEGKTGRAEFIDNDRTASLRCGDDSSFLNSGVEVQKISRINLLAEGVGLG